MPLPQAEPIQDRREQIMQAAMGCFAKRGFHQASMHDISAEAGISVGLIYRYFANKEAVISAMADRHKQEIQEVLERARQAPSLLESLEMEHRPATPKEHALVMRSAMATWRLRRLNHYRRFLARNKHHMDLTRTMHAPHQNLFNIGGPARPGDQHHRAGLLGRIRKYSQQFI